MFAWIDAKGKIRESIEPPESYDKGKIVSKDKACGYFKEYLRSLNYCLYKPED